MPATASTAAPSPPASRTLESLEAELTTLAAHLNAGNYRFLKLLAEFDRRGGHVGIGIASCAHWLQWKCGIGMVAAREKVRVARALERLPKLSDAMRRGVLSYCKVRALTRIATPENEAFLVKLGETGTVTHVERTVRLYRQTDRKKELDQANTRRAERQLSCYFDETGDLVIQGRLDPELGALVMKTLQAAADALREAARDASREAPRPAAPTTAPDASREARPRSEPAPDEPKQPYPARLADGLGLICETFLSTEEGRSHIEGGPSLPPASVRRLCCDASLVAIVEREDGTPLDVGRKTRAIPPAMRRALEARDRGCRFPGCTNTRFVDGHHIEHWADGGETKLTNLVSLCRRHHRFVHEYGFTIERDGTDFRFVRPDGRPIPLVPATEAVDATTGWQALTTHHDQLGLHIGPRTGVPKWFGERMDYGEALGALRDADPNRRTQRQPTHALSRADSSREAATAS